MNKLTILTVLLLLTSCASFTKSAAVKKINIIYNHLIYKDSVFNGRKLKDSLNISRIKRLENI